MFSRESCKYTFSNGKPSKFLNSFGRGFVMASLNINSLLAHIDDLRIFVTDSKIDILAINETKLDSSIGDSETSVITNSNALLSKLLDRMLDTF